MNWKIKAIGQKSVAALPASASYKIYSVLQKTLGKMNAKSADPTRLIERTVLLLQQIQNQNRPIKGKTFLEVGTGWKLTTPMVLWLCGAEKVITVDLNPYLRPDLVQLEAEYICQNSDLVIDILAKIADRDCLQERIAELNSEKDRSLAALMSGMSIEYMAPADASSLSTLGKIDYHISHTVFEHIPEPVLLAILQEAKRLLTEDGLCIHFIDPSDHFAHRDRNISEVNFLRFSEKQWNFWANNRYAYHNRLRVDDYEALFLRAGLSVMNMVVERDPRAVDLLAADFPLAAPFAMKSQAINASTKLLITAQQQQ